MFCSNDDEGRKGKFRKLFFRGGVWCFSLFCFRRRKILSCWRPHEILHSQTFIRAITIEICDARLVALFFPQMFVRARGLMFSSFSKKKGSLIPFFGSAGNRHFPRMNQKICLGLLLLRLQLARAVEETFQLFADKLDWFPNCNSLENYLFPGKKKKKRTIGLFDR